MMEKVQKIWVNSSKLINAKFLAVIIFVMLLLVFGYNIPFSSSKTTKIDDWVFSPEKEAYNDNSNDYSQKSSLFFLWVVICVVCYVCFVWLAYLSFKDSILENFKTKHLVFLIALTTVFFSMLFLSIYSRILFFITTFQVVFLVCCGCLFGLLKEKKYMVLIPILIIFLFLVLGFFTLSQYRLSSDVVHSRNVNGYSRGKATSAPMMSKSFHQSESIGLSVGGAKDISNFRENIKNGYLPLYSDITYEGLFYDYYFDTSGKMEESSCSSLFCPSYSHSISRDPLCNIKEHYLSVGLNSGIKEEDFKRKKLNLVVCLDISGSMAASFDRYYYDRFGNTKIGKKNEKSTKSKMKIASESIVKLLDHLKEGDRVGVVLFDHESYLGKPLNPAEETDMKKVRNHILELEPRGGTNFEKGYKLSLSLFKDYSLNDPEYENRIIVLTDMMPNTGNTNEGGLFQMTKESAEKKIYTTFLGIGVDFNTELTEIISKIKGCNYYSVHSEKEFSKRMDEEFEFMVTPLVFNLDFRFSSNDYEIEKVFGSPEAEEATGKIMKINTLFPSKREDGKSKGGIVLLKLKKKKNSNPNSKDECKLVVTYENRYELILVTLNRFGKKEVNEVKIILKNEFDEKYPNTGIRKAILLSRYGSMVKNIINHERRDRMETPIYFISMERGIIVPQHPSKIYGKWERQSKNLLISHYFKKPLKVFIDHFESEIKEIGDESLKKEIVEMKILYKKSETGEVD